MRERESKSKSARGERQLPNHLAEINKQRVIYIRVHLQAQQKTFFEAASTWKERHSEREEKIEIKCIGSS